MPIAHPADPRLADFLRQLPKSETHLHIEGALPWDLLHRMDPKRFATPPASWKSNYRFSSFHQFELELLHNAVAWFLSPERYHEAAQFIFSRLGAEQGVVYVETSFASGMVEAMRLDGAEVARAIASAAPQGMVVKVFMGIHHNGYHAGSRDFIEDSLGWPDLAGLDLHGTETMPLEPWTADLWARARVCGKETKAHAGEFMGAGFVRRAVEELGVRRVQHGVRAIEDPAVVDLLIREGVVLDVCPISNVKLNVVESMAVHPLRKLVDAGVVCTISTDDPMSFGNVLEDEYTALHRELGFSLSELGNLARNGLVLADEQPLVRAAIERLDSLLVSVADER